MKKYGISSKQKKSNFYDSYKFNILYSYWKVSKTLARKRAWKANLITKYKRNNCELEPEKGEKIPLVSFEIQKEVF